MIEVPLYKSQGASSRETVGAWVCPLILGLGSQKIELIGPSIPKQVEDVQILTLGSGGAPATILSAH